MEGQNKEEGEGAHGLYVGADTGTVHTHCIAFFVVSINECGTTQKCPDQFAFLFLKLAGHTRIHRLQVLSPTQVNTFLPLKEDVAVLV
jgi:hypothetical protein